MRDKGIHNTESCSGKMHDCSQDDIEEQTKDKRIKLSNPEESSINCHNRKSRKDKFDLNKKSSRDKSENMIDEGDADVLNKDSIKKLKKEEKAHKATQEQVKTLKTKIRCLTSDYSELQTQLAEMEENMNKLKKESAKEIDFLKVCLAAKKEAELVSTKAACGRNQTNVMIEKDPINRTKPATKTVAVQMDGNSNESGQVGVARIEKKLIEEPVKLELVEEVSVMVESVLAENTKVMQANADLITENNKLQQAIVDLELKSDERRNAQKVFFEKFDQLKEEERELRAKVFRITIENMKLKTENHEARAKSSSS